jgi:DNA-binding MarR family transcriptional regulator
VERTSEVPLDHDVAVADGLVMLAATIVRLLPRDISLTASGALMSLQRTGPRRLTDLAASEGVTQPGMTDLVTRLERDGLARRVRDSDDKRVVWVSLTAAGEQFVACRYHGAAQQLAEVVGQLSEEDTATILAALPALARLRELGVSCDGPGPC